MRSTFVYTFIAVSVCSAVLISSASAGGQRLNLGLSSSATTSTSATATGRSPLGEPVFLIPSTTTGSVSAPSGGPIGGYVPPRTPLPPLVNPGLDPNAAALVTTTANNSSGGVTSQHVSPARERVRIPEKPTIMGGTDRGTRVIFTPPPTIVGVPPSVTGTGNIAGNNLADRTFGPSILNTGLSGGQGQLNPAPWIRITPLQYNGPTVEVPTASSISKTSSSTSATGH